MTSSRLHLVNLLTLGRGWGLPTPFPALNVFNPLPKLGAIESLPQLWGGEEVVIAGSSVFVPT